MKMKQAINQNIDSHDDFEQYNCRENIKIYGVPKFSWKKDDGEQILFKIADELGIDLNIWDIQQFHYLDKKKPRNGCNGNGNFGKTTSSHIIVKFVSYKKRT